jgi:outer membrane lipoprotein-sorting protein
MSGHYLARTIKKDRVMKKLFMALVVIGMACGAGVQAAEKQATPQQQRMTVCNQQAGAKSLKGDERKSFMSNCLKKDAAQAEKKLTPQQAKMKRCNADAAKKSLSGDARKSFMSSCLKKA